MGAPDVINMRVRDDDCFDFELMAVENFRNLTDLFARIDDIASRVCSSPKMEQLHWRRPTGKTMWIN